jgi:ethanolamine-phosphate cytidylyltransferase
MILSSLVLVILKTKSWKLTYSLKMYLSSRLALVSGLKWVDEVITDAPYAITDKFLNRLFHEYNIDYVIHGDDPCLLPDGTDAYAAAKKAGRYKQIKRTEGVSSTDIVGTELNTYIRRNPRVL